MTHHMAKGSAGLLASLAALLVAGCAGSITVRTHEPLNLKALGTTLRIGESTREDVLAQLGVPAGKGRAMLPFDEVPRTVWVYTYAQGTVPLAGGTGRLDAEAVFVYFKGERYDGSLYGSSFMK
jgi:hypothetical protein